MAFTVKSITSGDWGDANTLSHQLVFPAGISVGDYFLIMASNLKMVNRDAVYPFYKQVFSNIDNVIDTSMYEDTPGGWEGTIRSTLYFGRYFSGAYYRYNTYNSVGHPVIIGAPTRYTAMVLTPSANHAIKVFKTFKVSNGKNWYDVYPMIPGVMLKVPGDLKGYSFMHTHFAYHPDTIAIPGQPAIYNPKLVGHILSGDQWERIYDDRKGPVLDNIEMYLAERTGPAIVDKMDTGTSFWDGTMFSLATDKLTWITFTSFIYEYPIGIGQPEFESDGIGIHVLKDSIGIQ